jgi:CHAD domain-containing protein
LRWVDEIISPVRNAQVLLNRFSTYPKNLKTSSLFIAESLQTDLKNAQSLLRSELNSLNFQQFLSYQNFETNESIPTIHSNEPVIGYLKEFNSAAWKSLSKAAMKADDDGLHKVRIKAKKVRYLAEASVPIIGKSLKDQAKIAGKIQTSLGYLQDSFMMSATIEFLEAAQEILEYERKERKQIKKNWRRFARHNF